MGYTTDFYGAFTLSRPATDEEMNYINTFSATRRMKRDVNKLMKLYGGKYGHLTPENDTPEGIYGKDGEYFILDFDDDGSVIDVNTPPGQVKFGEKAYFLKNSELIKAGKCQPGLWCQWILSDSQTLEWDGGEKFYEYIEWLKYLIKHFFERWNIKLNGTVEWNGEYNDDVGKIEVIDNIVKIYDGNIAYIEREQDI